MCKIEIRIKDNDDVVTSIEGEASVFQLLCATVHTVSDIINDDTLVPVEARKDITKEAIKILKSLVK